MAKDTVEKETQLDLYAMQWHHRMTDPFMEGYEKRLFDLAKYKGEKITLPPIDMLEYQETIIDEILENLKKKDEIVITKQNIESNRIVNEEYPTGIKLTKFLTKKLRESSMIFNDSDPRIDYLNKLKRPDNEYYLDPSPLAMLDMYTEIETCVSPYGENSGNIFFFMASPYTYMAYDKYKTVRSIVFLDKKDKTFFINQFYGENDRAFSYSLAKYFKEEGYSYVPIFDQKFDCTSDTFYEDSSMQRKASLYKKLGIPKAKDFECVNFLQTPEGMESIDVYTGFETRNRTTSLEFSVGVYCSTCDSYVDEYDFNYEYDACHDCAQEHCEECGSYVEPEEYDYQYDMCSLCTNEYIQRVKKEAEEEEEYEESV